MIGAPLSGHGLAPRPAPLAAHGAFRDVLRGLVSPSRLPGGLTPPARVAPAATPVPVAAVTSGRVATAQPATGRKAALQAAIHRASTSVGVDPALSLGVARAESNFDPSARSTDGLSMGTFQVTRATASAMQQRIAAHQVARPVGSDDVALGVGYLRYLHDLFGRDAKLARGLSTVPVPDAGERRLFAVAAFNAGEGRVAQAQARARAAGGDPTHFADVQRYLPSITQQYVDRVATYSRESALA